MSDGLTLALIATCAVVAAALITVAGVLILRDVWSDRP